jgi:histidine ammonia-lyase
MTPVLTGHDLDRGQLVRVARAGEPVALDGDARAPMDRTHALGAASERVVKSLDPLWSGLPTGLVPEGGTAHAGLTDLSLAAQSLAVEARLLAAPVSFEPASTAYAEGIEDRTMMASLDGLAAAVRRGEIARAALDATAEPVTRGNGDVDRP